MYIRVKPDDTSMFDHETFSEIMLDDPQLYNFARLAFGIEDGVDIECLDVMDDRIIARLKFDEDA